MFPAEPEETQISYAPPLPGDWRAQILPDGSERITLSQWGEVNLKGGYVGAALVLAALVGLRVARLEPVYLAAVLVIVFLACLVRVFTWREAWVVGRDRLVVRSRGRGRDAFREHTGGELRIVTVLRDGPRFSRLQHAQLIVVSAAGTDVLAERSRWSYPTVKALGEHLAALTGWPLRDEAEAALPDLLGM